jgi:mannose-6-phosphate isomerase-like protein (cupin superfamily)
MRVVVSLLIVVSSFSYAHQSAAPGVSEGGGGQPPAAGTRDASGGQVLNPEEGERLMWCDVPELRATIKVSPATTGGKAPFAVGTAELTGTNTGTHRENDEVIYFISGEGSAFVGDTTIRIRPGAMMYVPRGVRHGFTREGTEPVRFAWVTSPPGLEEQFRASGHPPGFDCSKRAVAAPHFTSSGGLNAR